MGASKTYNHAKRFYYWPVMFDWIIALIADCLTCLMNKLKPSQRIEVPLEDWQEETTPFRTIHIDHKGHLHPPLNRNLHCLLVIDAFSRFLMVYPVIITGAQATISAIQRWIHSFGIPQSIAYDGGSAFISTGFINWTKNWESPCDLEQRTLLGLLVKLKPKVNTLPVIGGTSWTTLGSTGLH